MANKKLKRGELLFNEGDPSKSMYFIQKGSIRLYKKKGNTPIELGMIHTGEVIGEMGFLDGGPRSAAAEAITETELMEITSDKMQDQLKILQPWLIVLLKTVVNRLRTANTKIKQLETASTTITYGRDGLTQTYAFLNNYDILKAGTAILLSGARTSEKTAEGYSRIKLGAVQKYGNQIMGLHLSKIMEFIELMGRFDVLKIDRQSDAKGEKVDIFLKDIDFLEQFVTFVNDENLKDHSKKTTLSLKGVFVMSLIDKYAGEFPADASGIATVNMASIFAREKEANGGKDPYLTDDFNELVKNKLATELSIVDAKNANTKILREQFLKIFRFQKILKEIESINQDKQRRAA